MAEFGIGNDLIVIAMHHEDRHFVIFLRSSVKSVSENALDAVVVRLGAAHHALPPPVLDNAGDWLRARPVKTIEGTAREIEIELCPLSASALRKPSKPRLAGRLDWPASSP
jgi:hypothetical protein